MLLLFTITRSMIALIAIFFLKLPGSKYHHFIADVQLDHRTNHLQKQLVPHVNPGKTAPYVGIRDYHPVTYFWS